MKIDPSDFIEMHSTIEAQAHQYASRKRTAPQTRSQTRRWLLIRTKEKQQITSFKKRLTYITSKTVHYATYATTGH